MSTSEQKIDEVINEIASEHGIVIPKDDPIMMLHTINKRLILDSKVAQHDLLDNFRSQMEVISNGWSIEAKNHSDRILNSAVSSSKAEVARVMEEQSRVIIEKWKEELNTGFSEVLKTTQSSRQTAILNIIASFITLISAIIVFYVFLTI